MTGKWPDLVAELDRWGETGHVASLWWRDDDAVAPTPELIALLQVAGAAPVALSVIPAEASRELRGFLDTAAALTGLIGHLQARRLGQVIRGTVTGILTHHLVMDRVGAGFLDRLAATVERHMAARWATTAELLAA